MKRKIKQMGRGSGLLCALMLSAAAQAQTTWSGLASAVTAAPAAGTINLANDIAYDSGTTIPLSKSLTIKSNTPGTLRTITGNNAFRLFNVSGATTINLSDVVLTLGNLSGEGNAIYVASSATLTGNPDSQLVFSGNRSTNGVLRNLSTTSVLQETHFLNNTATGQGGGLYNSGTISLAGLAEFTSNVSAAEGGGIYNAVGATAKLLGNTSFVTNTSSGGLGGGGIANGGTVIFGAGGSPVTVTFKGNKARLGSGFYNYAGPSRATFYGDVEFDSNVVTAGTYGGALDNDGQVLITGNAVFKTNTGSDRGGAIFNYSYTNTRTEIQGNATFTDNVAALYGGAIFNHNNSETVIGGDAAFEGNVARYGGGIYLDGGSKPLTLNVAGTQVYSGNVANNGTAGPVAAAGGFLYTNAAITTAFNIGGQLTIGTCAMDGTDSIASASGSAIINKTGSGTLVLSATNSGYPGAWNVNAGFQQAGCENTFAANATHTVATGAELSASGFNQTVKSITNNGTVATGLASTAPGAVLTVSLNYAGAAGSALRVNTQAGDSASATDKLLVSGNATGTSQLSVINVGGAGAQTTGNGILVVQVTGTSSAVFSMTPFRAGNFMYELKKVANNWYLQSYPLVPITITKNVTGATAGYVANSTFTITLNCGADYIQTSDLKNGASSAEFAVLPNASCSVTETVVPSAATGYSYGAPIITPASPFTATLPSVAVTVANPLLAIDQPITVRKTVSGALAGYVAASTFPITLNCGSGLVYNLNLAKDGSVVQNVPFGSSCTVTEGTPPAPAAGYTYGTPTFTNDTFIVPLDGLTATVDNPITANAQTISVTKTVAGATAGYDNMPFLIRVDCGAVGSQMMSLANGETGTYSAPTGAVCTVSETTPTNPSGYAYNAPLISDPSFTVGVGGKAVTVTNTLVAQNQPIIISKYVSGDTGGYVAGTTFSITATCNGVPTTQALAKDQTMTVQAPTGTLCTVAESTPANPLGYAYGTPIISDASFTVPPGGKNVGVTNTLTAQSQAITVTKTVTGDTRGYAPGTEFVILVQCGADGSKVLNLANGASGTFNAPTGATCTVTETTPQAPLGYTYSAPAVTPNGAFTVNAGANPVALTNALTALNQTLSLRKVVTGDVGGYVAGTTFTVTTTCDTIAPVVSTLENGETATVSVPTGSTCTVSEAVPVNPAGYVYESINIAPSSFTMPAGGLQVGISNNLVAQNQIVTITKALTGDTWGLPPATTFPVTITCGSGSATLQLSPGASGTFSPPTGETCNVTEPTPVAPPGYTFSAPVIDAASFTVAAGGNSVLVTNHITANSQPINVKKIVSGDKPGLVASSNFPMSLSCTSPGGAVLNTSLNAQDDATATFNFITGANCTLTESIPAGAAQAGYAWGTPTLLPATFTIAADGVEAQVINPIAAQNQLLTITKTLSGAQEGYSGETFAITVNCPSFGAKVLDLAAGSTGSLNPVTGETCTVSEATPTNPVGYVYNTPEISSPSFVVAAGGNAVVVANELVAQPQIITVTKTVAGTAEAIGAGYVAGSTFPITVSCTHAIQGVTSFTVNLADGASDNGHAAPTGSVCTVSETVPGNTVQPGYEWGPVGILPASFTLSGPQTVVVTNTVKASMQNISVTTTMAEGTTGALAAGFVAGTMFPVTLTCDGTPLALSLAHTAGSGTVQAPTGAVCTVVAVAPPSALKPGYGFDATVITSASFTVGAAAGSNSVAITNTIKALPQTITVNKTVTGATAGYVSGTFPITLNCGAAGTQTVNVANGAPETASVITGASCTVTEGTKPGLSAGYSWGTEVISPLSFNVVAGSNIVSIANPVVANAQTISVTATVSGSVAGYAVGASFPITVTCTSGVLTQGILKDGVTSFTGIARTGDSCNVTEGTLPALNPGYTWGTPTINPSGFLVGSTGQSVVVNHPITATAQTITVTNRVTGTLAGYTAGSTFAVQVTCNGVPTPLTLAKDGVGTVSAPTGASCVVAETGKPTPVSGYEWDFQSTSPSSSFTVLAGGNLIEINNPLRARAQDVTVTKTITGATAGYVANSTFSVAVSCTTAGNTPLNLVKDEVGTVAASTGDSCSVTESAQPTPVPGYAWGTPVVTPSGSNEVPATGLAVSVVTPLLAIDQPITVRKTVSGALAGYVAASTFPITLNCGSGLVYNLNLAKDGSVVQNVPFGSSCTVTEGTPPAPAAGYTYGTPTFTNDTFIVPLDGLTATVDNPITANAQTISVTKTVAGATAGYDNMPFLIRVDCGAVGSQMMSLANGETGTYSAPTGAVCTVSETTPTNPSGYAYNAPLISDPSFTVGVGGKAVTVTNTLVAQNQPIIISKYVSGDTGGYVAGTTFSITATCNGVPTTQALAKDQTMTVQAPTGTLCTVAESTPANPLGYAYGTPIISDASFTVPPGGKNVGVTNTLTAQSQAITVTKTVTGDTRGYAPGTEFVILVQCGADGSKVLNLANGASGTFNAPTGATCTVTETTPQAPLGYTYSAPAVTPNGAFTVNAGANPVALTNALTALNQTLSLRKVVTGDVGGYVAGTTFTVTTTCDTIAPVVSTLENGETATVSVPTGSTCTVSEAVPVNPAGYVYESINIAPSSFTMPAGGLQVGISNNLVAQNQIVTITKALTGDTWGLPPATTFPVTITCGSGSATLQLSPGASGTFSPPTGETCNVTEPTPVAPPGYTFSAPVIDAASFTVAAGGNSVLVTNHITANSQPINVKKIVSGDKPGLVASSNFPMSLSCTSPGGAVLNTSLNAQDDATATFNFITGANCTLTESIPAGAAQAGYAWGTPTLLPATFTIAADGVEAQVINPIAAQNQLLTITKTLSGAQEGYSGETFAITVNCPSFGAKVLDLAAGSTGSLNPVTGETCTVSEATPTNPVGYVYNTPEISSPSFVVAAGGNAVVVANELVAQPQIITVTKTVAGAVGAGYVANATFPITVSCTHAVQGTTSFTVNLANGVSDSANAAPTGSECTVSETVPANTVQPGYAWGSELIVPTSFTLSGPQTVAVTNTVSAVLQNISVTTTMAEGTTGALAAGFVAGTMFPVTLTCDGVLLPLSLAHTAGSGTVQAPTGAVCAVVAVAPSSALKPGYGFGATVITSASFTVGGVAGSNSVAITNTIKALPQTITVNKTVTGATAGYIGGTFPITVNCGADGTSTLDVTVGTPSTMSAITGASCTVSEGTKPGLSAGYSWDTEVISPLSFDVVAGTNTVNVSNPVVANAKNVTVTKTVTGATAGYVANSTFSVAVNCTTAGNTPLNLVKDEVGTVAASTGDSCSVTESTQPTPVPGYAWGTPVVTPSGSNAVPAIGLAVSVATPLLANPQTMSITNTVTGDVAGYVAGSLFSITLNCGAAGVQTVNLDNMGVADTSITIPTGASCTASVVPPPAAAGYSFNTTVSPPASFSVVNGGQIISVATQVVRNMPPPLMAIPMLDVRALLMLALLMLGLGWRARKAV